MKSIRKAVTLAASAYIAGALAQTPPNTLPATNVTLGVTYNETVVTPGLLFPPSSTLIRSSNVDKLADETSFQPLARSPMCHSPMLRA
jgi:hypothetical protein